MTAVACASRFAVSDVTAGKDLLAEVLYHEAVADFLGGPVEACSRYHGRLVAGVRSHPLIAALHGAFAQHRPLCLSPDIVWLTLCQGLAHHVNANAESLRHRLVRHTGRIPLVVRRDDLLKGSPENPWAEVFAEFSATLRDHLGPTRDLIVADFSTTGPLERAASEVALLDAMQSFFSYEVRTMCGIPEIILEGTPDDWREIGRRVREFARFDLGWWTEPLGGILSQFEAASRGNVNREFWDSIYKWEGPQGSGSFSVTGWVLNLFPYLTNPEARLAWRCGRPTSAPAVVVNRWIGEPPARYGPGRDEFPSLPAKAPFTWNYHGTEFEMEFIGGLIGVSQDRETLALRPEIGWAVRGANPA